MRISMMDVGKVMQRRRTNQTKGLLKRSKNNPSMTLGKGVKKATRSAGAKRE